AWWRPKKRHDEDPQAQPDPVLHLRSREERLLQEIDEEAPDHRTAIADVLRKAVALGDKAGSAELQNWATHELQGYGQCDGLPQYRQIEASLLMDTRPVRGKALSPLELPPYAQEAITNIVRLQRPIA